MPSEVITEKKIKNSIEEALKKGFTIKQIKEGLIDQGWPELEVSEFIFNIKEKKLTDLPIKAKKGQFKVRNKEKIILKPLKIKESFKPEIKKPVLKSKESKIKRLITPKYIKETKKIYPKIKSQEQERQKIKEWLKPEIEKLIPQEIHPKKEQILVPPHLEGYLKQQVKYPEQIEEIKEEIKPIEEQVEDLEKEIEVPPIQISKENQRQIKLCATELQNVKKEISKIIVGQEKVVSNLLKAVLSDGHVLVEGVPGIAKTLLIRTLAKVTGCNFKRIQFTVDLLPTDIVGFISYTKEKGFYTIKGPIFANFIIADEINRATPKSQSALLEAMQEKQVTIGKSTFSIPIPFFVMANKNPIESSGVYPLPEAQRDRFLFKVFMDYPTTEEEKLILKQNISLKNFEDFDLKSIINPSRIIKMQEITKSIYLDPEIEKYIIEITNATRHPSKYNIEYGKYIEYGASPRASISMFIASKADALLNGKLYVSPQNVKNIAREVLRHRIILNYEALAEKIKEDQIINEILSKVQVP